MTDLDIERLQAVDLRPGDTIVVTVPERTSLANAEVIRNTIELRFPTNPVLVVPDGTDIEVVRPH